MLALLLLQGCSKPGPAHSGAPEALAVAAKEAAPGAAAHRGKYLAYEHSVTVDAAESEVKPLLDRLVAACHADAANQCTLLASGIQGGRGLIATGREWSVMKEDTTMEGIADCALWLLSDLGRSTTGEVVHVDAGFHIVGVPDTGGGE